uniref:HscB tetracysteine metal binding motif domain-containing protein n=1 Tax=Podarcis muralis TaxID=64176 RepID=A0A670KHE9_PODMU
TTEGWRLLTHRSWGSPWPAPAGRAPASCWSCGLALPPASPPPRFFCPSCRALQPPEPRADLFRLLGCCFIKERLRRDVSRLPPLLITYHLPKTFSCFACSPHMIKCTFCFLTEGT